MRHQVLEQRGPSQVFLEEMNELGDHHDSLSSHGNPHTCVLAMIS